MMAKMIPPDYSSDTPAGEAILFDKLRDDPGTEGWVVLHSLNLSRHRNKSEGEIDIVLLVPGYGVLCLEVKGCTVNRQSGRWVYPYGTSAEGPFRQASGAMHSLRDYIGDRDASLSRLLFFSAVAFTRIHFNEESPEWHSWQIIDVQTLGRMPISKIIGRIFERAHQHIGSGKGRQSWYDEQLSRPTPDQVRRLTGLLRGNFEYMVQPKSDVLRIEESLLRLTEEQYEALDALQENSRVVIKGLAGTGKTFLAIEAARRAVNGGKKVLLLCFNRLLAESMSTFVDAIPVKESGQLRCLHLHGLMREITGNSIECRNDHEFWSRELPTRVLDCLLEADNTAMQFDLLLVDEAQDILTEEYLDVLDLLVKGGLAGGKWVLFGDFERQAIYLSGGGASATHMLEILRQRTLNYATFTLRVNCRNAGPIAETLVLACNVSPGYRRYLHEMEGASVDPRFWSSAEDQAATLNEMVSELRRAFHADDIIVLSLKADERSCAGQLGAGGSGNYVSFREFVRTAKGAIRFSSVHAFKGLEAAAIIVTDIVRLDEQSRALLYVAMSRARIRLILLMHENTRKEYDRMLLTGLGLNDGR